MMISNEKKKEANNSKSMGRANREAGNTRGTAGNACNGAGALEADSGNAGKKRVRSKAAQGAAR